MRRADVMNTDKPAVAVDPGWRIAVIDDDPGVRRSVWRLLRAAGFDVVTFESAEDYLADATASPRCLVLDVQLGGQTGLDLYRALEEHHRALPVIFITSHEEYLETASPGEQRVWLRKPFESRDLIDAIRRVVRESEIGSTSPFGTATAGNQEP